MNCSPNIRSWQHRWLFEILSRVARASYVSQSESYPANRFFISINKHRADIRRPCVMCSILLVEDHPDTQRAFAAILRSWGHQVATSDSAAGGLAVLEETDVDVILSDIGLPDQNGYDFIAEVRRNNTKVVAIAVSAYFTAADQERGHKAGFDMHFSKPVDLLSLRLALSRVAQTMAPMRRGQATALRAADAAR